MMSKMKAAHEFLLRHRVGFTWALPALWMGTLLLPTSGDAPWKYLIICLLAFAFALRTGVLAFAARCYRIGLVWFLAGAVVLILNFAKLYLDTGLVDSSGRREVSIVEAIYFSLVTWTTLGYGDFAPPADIKIYAALEALLGYVYMGVTVGVTVSLIGSFTQANKTVQTDAVRSAADR